LADVVEAPDKDTQLWAARWSFSLTFDHRHPVTSNVALRRALAHAIDREALTAVCPANLVVATGGLVPPALQGHTPEIAPRFDPELARELLARSGVSGGLRLAGLDDWETIIETIAEGWRDALGLEVTTRTWTRDRAWKLARPW